MTNEPGKEKPKDRVEAIEETLGKLIDICQEITTRMDSLEKTTVKKTKGLFGGKREKTAIKDTKTGKIYPSKASVGKALATEFNEDPGDHFVWYKITAKAPERFVDASAEEAEKCWAEEKARIEAEVAEANKRLAEEEAKKVKEGKK